MGQQYDLIVIGAGPGGYPAALAAAGLGKRTAVVERRDLGGTCLNRGCIPAKTLLHTSGLCREIREGGRFGILCEPPELDFTAMWEHKTQVVQTLRDGIGQMFRKQKIDLYQGSGRVTGENAVEVTAADGTVTELTAEHILIAAGSVPAVPPIPGAGHPRVFVSDHVLDENHLGVGADDICGRIVIIGGGVIGMEMATVYSDLGSQVTVLEAMERILPTMDREIAQNLKMIMKKRGVEIHTSATVRGIEEADSRSVVCRYEEKGVEATVEADGILIATGRRPDTSGLLADGLQEKLLSERGYIQVDEHYRTAVPGIYAVGDVIGGIQLAHVAEAEGRRAVEHMFDRPFAQNLNVIPSCVYTDPEIACTGMTADEAKAAGIAVKTGKYIMSVNGKSVLTAQERGFIKLVAEVGSGRLIGAQLMCARATDMIGELELAITNQMTAAQLAEVVMAHPTFEEGIGEAAREML